MPRRVADVAYIAARCMEHDTVVALAFRKALGIVAEPRCRRGRRDSLPKRTAEWGDAEVYGGMSECFENRKAVLL